jgi:hypothetical protein
VEARDLEDLLSGIGVAGVACDSPIRREDNLRVVRLVVIVNLSNQERHPSIAPSNVHAQARGFCVVCSQLLDTVKGG